MRSCAPPKSRDPDVCDDAVMADPIVQLTPEARARVSSAIAALVPTDPDRFLAALELG